MATSENTSEDKKAPREAVDRTIVMEDAPEATSGSRSGTRLSDVIDGAPGAIDRVDPEAPPSPESRRQSSKTKPDGKVSPPQAGRGSGRTSGGAAAGDLEPLP